MGSGTTAIAALKSDRKYIGFEINQDYIDLTNKRTAPFENMLRL
jgi:site-specific DNA-methyltransferase (adenine-specific)